MRYIGNSSTGKQGIAIAEAAQRRGADVTLILANSDLPTHSAIKRIDVATVSEMQSSLASCFPEADALFMTAAISDARPVKVSTEKIKKDQLSAITLVENPDVLATIAANKSHQYIVAFAAETESNSIAAAQAKLLRKNADVIYLNNVAGGAVFGSSHTSGTLIDANGVIEVFENISKESLAHSLINHALTGAHKLG